MRADDAIACSRRRGIEFGPADDGEALVGGKDDVRGDLGFEGAIEVGEGFDVEHVDLVDEEDAGDELGDTLVDVPVDDLVDLGPQLVGDLGPATLDKLAHDRHDILPALGSRVGHVEVVKGDVLDDLLLLVDVTLRQGDVFLGLEVKFGRVGVGPANALDRARIGLDVDHVADDDALLLDGLENCRVEAELFGALDGFEADDDVANRLAVARERVLGLGGRELDNLALVDLLGLLDAQA
jgi:hypothetical protein